MTDATTEEPWDLVVTSEFQLACGDARLERVHAQVRLLDEWVWSVSNVAPCEDMTHKLSELNQGWLIAIVSLGRNAYGQSLLQRAFEQRAATQDKAQRARFVAFVCALLSYDDQFRTLMDTSGCAYSPFGYACDQGLFEVVRCVLQMQSEDVPVALRPTFLPLISQTDDEGVPLLHASVVRDRVINAVQLICLGRQSKTVAQQQESAEALALADECDSRILKLLLDNKVPCDVPSETGHSPLMHAAYRGSVALCVALLDCAPHTINMRSAVGHSALWLACVSPACGPEVVEILVAYGASPFVCDAHGRSLIAILRAAQPTPAIMRATNLYKHALDVHRRLLIESYNVMSGMAHVKAAPDRAASRLRYLFHQYRVGDLVQEGDLSAKRFGVVRSTTDKALYRLEPMAVADGFAVQVDSIDYAFPGQMIEIMAHITPSDTGAYEIPAEFDLTVLPNVHDHGADDAVTYGMGAHTVVLRLGELLAHKGMLKKSMGDEARRMRMGSETQEECADEPVVRGVQVVKDAADYEQLMYYLDRMAQMHRHGAELAKLVFHRDLRDQDFCMHVPHEDDGAWTCMTHVFVSARSFKTFLEGEDEDAEQQTALAEAWYPEIHLKVRLVRKDAAAMLLDKANRDIRVINDSLRKEKEAEATAPTTAP